ncbi:protein RGF1 INDUCIBLE TRANSCRIPTION FACTOR 1 [Cornus florida]|uniref:protein RGF1 INDUCIBLE TRANSCRIPTION FACTOR 1 n=1 Tax=Cornus florida TaxID=4283 RepID=UPI0028A1B73B|nr:protein RGF1 INDUCIBLE TRANSCRIPTION FACTOR 1 [Cornus florida]
MVGCGIRLKKRNPEWLSSLLRSKFFRSCVDHRDLRKNEKNVFCIDCTICLCKHCIVAHDFHRWLQICRYVYHDVVRLQDIQKHLDCSKIQTYKINGEKAVHLNPRPQSRDPKPLKSKSGASCQACGRYIQDLPNHFCSIACKFSKAQEISEDPIQKLSSFPFPHIDYLSLKDSDDTEGNTTEKDSSFSLSDSSQENHSSVSSVLKPKKQLHKRKGFPRRAPLS